jgi:8-oxo-dGTP pyrophosphatase MutT (NUDIX family)
MIPARRVDDGEIRIPVRLEAPDGAVGEGWADIGPDHPDFQKWDEHLTARDGAANKTADTPSKEGDAERLRQYWSHGEGAAKIGWGTPGDFDRCVVEVGKYMDDPKGYCAERHHDALGIWPATHAAMERGHKGATGTPVAAGLAVVAADTGRVLMIQRAASDDDPAGGMFEFPGGRLEGGETPIQAARREWSEETGLDIPRGGLAGSWASYNGIYQGFVLKIPHESDLPVLGDRDQVSNPDDPDGDCPEVIAWWDPDHLRNNPAVRDEIHADMNAVLGAIANA